MNRKEDFFTRRDVATDLGLTYATLRVYEKALKGILVLRIGPNRTSLYTKQDIDLIRRAITLKNEGYTFKRLKRGFLARMVIPSLHDWETRSTIVEDGAALPPDEEQGWEPFSSSSVDGYILVLWKRIKDDETASPR